VFDALLTQATIKLCKYRSYREE